MTTQESWIINKPKHKKEILLSSMHYLLKDSFAIYEVYRILSMIYENQE